MRGRGRGHEREGEGPEEGEGCLFHLAEVVLSSPANVLGACIEAVGPVGVGLLLVRVKVAERVDEALGKQCCEVLALLHCEASRLQVGLGVSEVCRREKSSLTALTPSHTPLLYQPHPLFHQPRPSLLATLLHSHSSAHYQSLCVRH